MMRSKGVIGLTGNIASGKSTVEDCLTAMGVPVVEADRIYGELVRPGGAAWWALKDHFGPGIFHRNNRLNRGALGKIVFDDPEKLALLNRITHPLVNEEADRQVAALKDAGAFPVVLSAPLFFEAGCEGRVDEVWFVWCADEERVRRLMRRNGFDEAEAWRRVRAQGDQDGKAKRSDVVIRNDGDLDDLKAQVRMALDSYMKKYGVTDAGGRG